MHRGPSVRPGPVHTRKSPDGKIHSVFHSLGKGDTYPRPNLTPHTPGDAQQILGSRKPRAPTFTGQATSGSPQAKAFIAGNRVQGPASIAELARSLKNDPDLIFQYVYNNIEYYPVFGEQKGALGTIIDGSGTDFDQAVL